MTDDARADRAPLPERLAAADLLPGVSGGLDALVEGQGSRRWLLRAGLVAGVGALLAGCGGGRRTTTASLPGPAWPTPTTPPVQRRTLPRYEPQTPAPSQPWAGDVVPRSAWAKGAPIPSRMDPMLPVQRITIHHDGMPPVSIRSQGDVASRLEQIRQGHLGRSFGDIGYHFVVDPMGRVWQGRPLTWQGAHVANQNPGNLGILCMGNFELQTPTQEQLASLDRFVGAQAAHYGVQRGQVYTHRELAPTVCPGRNLQRLMDRVRA